MNCDSFVKMTNLIVFQFKHYCFVLLLISFNLNHVLSEIIVYKNSSTDKIVRVITDYELSIGSDIPDEGIMAYIVTADPENACNTIKPPPKDPFHFYGNDTDNKFNWFVLVDRDYCTMDKKLNNVKEAGYSGVIIYNAKLTQLNMPELDYKLNVDFPVLLVTHIDGRQIKTFYTYDKGYFAWFLNNSPFHIYPFLVPFLVVIGACIIVIVSFMISQIIRCYNERKKRRRHRLAKRHLKKIPTYNFKKGDHYEICAICLDEFQEGVKLRLLNCGHAYHIKCIDPWLTENRRICPICKGKVVVPDLTDSESENDAENERNQNATERTPLLGNNNQQSQQNVALPNFSNDLIFPISRRIRRNRNVYATNNQNNVPSTSNIVNNNNSNNDLVINVATTTSNKYPFRSCRRFRGRSRVQINAEINSPSISNDNQPSTSRNNNIVVDQQLRRLNQTASLNDVNSSTNRSEYESIENTSNDSNSSSTTLVTLVSNNVLLPNTTSQSTNSNYSATSRPSRRLDNIV